MKKIIYSLLITATVMTSCESFIEPNNKSNIAADSFYETKTGFESLLNAAYSALRPIYGKEPYLFSSGVDLYARGRNVMPEIAKYSGLTPQDGNVKTFYTNCYEVIQLANAVIYYSDITESTDLIPQYVAEARFLRAFNYFLLVQQFGGIPLVKEYVNTPKYEFPRASVSEVYEYIISEMESLKSDLPAKTTVWGRIDQRTVNHMLAKIHLTRGWELNSQDDFTKAAQYAETAIGGQGLNLSFEEVFSPTNQQNEEIIWSVQYDEISIQDKSNDGSMQQAFFGTYLGGSEENHKYTTSTFTPTLRMHEVFTEGDARYEGTFMVELYKEYYYYYTRSEQLSSTEVLYYYPPVWLVDDTAAWRAANPATRSNTIIIPMMENTFSTTGAPRTYDDQASGEVFGVSCIKKFDDPTSLFSTKSSTRDVVVARLAETYLIAAEAYLKAGNTDKAVEMINVVRKRAEKPGYDLSVSTVNIDFILDERARELAGEYHRWTDLKRTGKLIEYCVAYNPEIISASAFGANGEKTLRPIPQDAIDLNHAEISQNPGY